MVIKICPRVGAILQDSLKALNLLSETNHNFHYNYKHPQLSLESDNVHQDKWAPSYEVEIMGVFQNCTNV